jgi:hypothetical protein
MNIPPCPNAANRPSTVPLLSWVVRVNPSEYCVCRTVCNPKLLRSTQGMRFTKFVATMNSA